MKTSTQLKALVRNLSKAKGVEAEIILRSFMLERFLERISKSEYKSNFILKGGMLIAAMVGIDTRTTMDLDATIKGQTLNETQITEIIEGILLVPVDDGVLFTFRRIEEIREEADYPGYRVLIDAALDKTRQTMHIDITTGDFVTPKEIEYSFKLMFEERSISILAYNLETVLAEKFESIVSRGLTNTRMRDFYDIYILTTTQQFDAATFRMALEKTSAKRKTAEQVKGAETVVERISENKVLTDLWRRYQSKYVYAADVSWEQVIEALRNLALANLR
ncbi:MAG: nucleotidyl transferase AbiEii/AbiGii toxin family protein [Oscillospiraceae bacterium]|jgi:predicted nucleotidyltransferase component of viral defense system|nr:nucleotidyl transferase AbiEii/AbiGii toxin family protein [Oscillospiraceae bacterium]